MKFIYIQTIVSLFSGFFGALILHYFVALKSKASCKKAVIKELEFDLKRAIDTVDRFKNEKRRTSFKEIDIHIYYSVITKHPDLFGEKQIYVLMFLYNGFKTYNVNIKKLTKIEEPKSPKNDIMDEKKKNLMNLLWEDIIKFFKNAPNDIIPRSLIPYKASIANSSLENNPPKIPKLFENNIS